MFHNLARLGVDARVRERTIQFSKKAVLQSGAIRSAKAALRRAKARKGRSTQPSKLEKMQVSANVEEISKDERKDGKQGKGKGKGSGKQPSAVRLKLAQSRVMGPALTFASCLPMHHLWVSHARAVLPLKDRLNVDTLGAALVKADLHGSIIRVAQSRQPTLVGIEGIVTKSRN